MSNETQNPDISTDTVAAENKQKISTDTMSVETNTDIWTDTVSVQIRDKISTDTVTVQNQLTAAKIWPTFDVLTSRKHHIETNADKLVFLQK